MCSWFSYYLCLASWPFSPIGRTLNCHARAFRLNSQKRHVSITFSSLQDGGYLWILETHSLQSLEAISKTSARRWEQIDLRTLTGKKKLSDCVWYIFFLRTLNFLFIYFIIVMTECILLLYFLKRFRYI